MPGAERDGEPLPPPGGHGDPGRLAFCGPCAREQEAYFALGELVEQGEGARGFRGRPLAEALKRLWRERGAGSVAEGHPELLGVDKAERLELTIG